MCDHPVTILPRMTPMPPAFHQPTPLDRIFLAIDQAWRRCGLPGLDIWVQIECDGRVDLPGMNSALQALARRYPAVNSRLMPAGFLHGRRWRMVAPPMNPPNDVVS